MVCSSVVEISAFLGRELSVHETSKQTLNHSNKNKTLFYFTIIP